MNESDYKRRLVKAVKALPGGWARRVEDRWAVGVLDMIIKLPGHPVFFAEGKIIDGYKFGPSLAQWEEGNRLIEADITPLLIGWRMGKMYISKTWVKQADARECFYDDGLDSLGVLRAYVAQFGVD